METFGLVGMVFGILGFVFGANALSRIRKLEQRIEEREEG